jgi:hypothetical protein
MKSLLLPLVGEDVHLERPSTSDAVLQPSRILAFATLCIIGWFQLLQMASSIYVAGGLRLLSFRINFAIL